MVYLFGASTRTLLLLLSAMTILTTPLPFLQAFMLIIGLTLVAYVGRPGTLQFVREAKYRHWYNLYAE
jgi:hypothetical protein